MKPTNQTTSSLDPKDQTQDLPPTTSELHQSRLIDEHYQDFIEMRDSFLRSIRPHSKLGLHRGENRVYKTPILQPQKGQKQFEVEGAVVWAGSLKAAIKKARKIKKQLDEQ